MNTLDLSICDMNYKPYIFPIRSTTDGSGVIVGDLFITAGHVIEDGIIPVVVIMGKSYSLDKEKALFFDVNPSKRSDGYDVAVYRLDGVSSPLKLANAPLSEGKEVLSCSYRHTISGEPGLSSNIFSSKIKENWIFEQRKGRIVSYYDNYFECQFEEPLSQGSSGSPIIDEDKVAGVLYGDKEGKNSSNTILFLSSGVILKKLNEIEKNK